jgi:hypothetical protein
LSESSGFVITFPNKMVPNGFKIDASGILSTSTPLAKIGFLIVAVETRFIDSVTEIPILILS